MLLLLNYSHQFTRKHNFHLTVTTSTQSMSQEHNADGECHTGRWKRTMIRMIRPAKVQIDHQIEVDEVKEMTRNEGDATEWNERPKNKHR